MSTTEEPIEGRRQRSPLVALVVIAAVGLFQVSLICDGYDWGGDFAQYIAHARNLQSGSEYSATGYVYSSQAAVVGPQSYPPMYPGLLSIVSLAVGENAVAFKVANVALFCVSLACLYLLARPRLSESAALILLAVVGFNPIFTALIDRVVSEHLFLPFWFGSILIAHAARSREERGIGNAMLLGLLVYLATATRSVGIVLLPSIVCLDLFCYRRITKFGATAIAVASAGMVVQKLMLPEVGGGYVDQLRQISAETILDNLWHYAAELSPLWGTAGTGMPAVIPVLVMGIAVIGFVFDNRTEPTFPAVASVMFFGLIVLWPAPNGVRMIAPLLPMLGYYAVCGFTHLVKPLKARREIGFCIVAMLAAVYAGSHPPDRSVKNGPDSDLAQSLFAWVEGNIEPDATVLFFKPRILAMYSGRRSAAYPRRGDWRVTKTASNATYAIIRHFEVPHTPSDPDVTGSIVYENGGFTVFDLSLSD